ncbi:MAG: FMN-binding protein [Chitinivibrionales bacterium]|nr:FMN-binding protein [Chitinivibrionales bacterium]
MDDHLMLRRRECGNRGNCGGSEQHLGAQVGDLTDETAVEIVVGAGRYQENTHVSLGARRRRRRAGGKSRYGEWLTEPASRESRLFGTSAGAVNIRQRVGAARGAKTLSQKGLAPWLMSLARSTVRLRQKGGARPVGHGGRVYFGPTRNRHPCSPGGYAMIKKILAVLAVIVAVAVIAVIAFVVRYRKMAETVDSVRVEDIDISTIQDGAYTGSFGDFLVHVEAKVTVDSQRIADIEIINQRCGKGYEALETVDRILAAQSPRVDAVSGATGSSKCIMVAVQNALASAPRREPVAREPDADSVVSE